MPLPDHPVTGATATAETLEAGPGDWFGLQRLMTPRRVSPSGPALAILAGQHGGRSGIAAAEGATARNRSGPIPSAGQLWRDRPMPAPKGHETQAGHAP